jgi:hypothetical protein
MKTTPFHKIMSAFAAVTLACTAAATADEQVTTTTTSAGTVTEFSPDTIVIRSETSPEPIRYSYSKTTTYVDEAGAPVSMEIVKSGLPVTVHYVHEGDRLIADRVIVHRRVTTAAPGVVEEQRTTTTTTTTGGRPANHEERKAEKEERKAEKHEEKAQRDLERAGDK